VVSTTAASGSAGPTTASPQPATAREGHAGPIILTTAPVIDVVQTTQAPVANAGSADSASSARVQTDTGAGSSRVHADVLAPNHFRGKGTESADQANDNRQTLLTLLAALAIALVIVTGVCLRTQPPLDANAEENLPLTDASPSTPRGAKSRRLEPGSELYCLFERQFTQKWDTTTWPTTAGRVVPPPRISAIYEIDAEDQLPAYKAKQREIESQSGTAESETPSNERVEFHGARLKCSYQGMPCLDAKCSVCRIIDSGSFGCDGVGGEIHFRAGSHAAKGQGLAPGKTPPPESLDDFVSSSAGNAVFVANVLLGTPQPVATRTTGPLPSGMHSRVAEKAYGVDEIVVFDEAQAIPRALVLFG